VVLVLVLVLVLGERRRLLLVGRSYLLIRLRRI
jgi:hypothetical protein